MDSIEGDCYSLKGFFSLESCKNSSSFFSVKPDSVHRLDHTSEAAISRCSK